MAEREILMGLGEPIHGKRYTWDGKGPAKVRKSGLWLWVDRQGRATSCPPHWIDHEYRFKADSGDVFYIAEPYQLSDDDIADLAKIASEGWKVCITSRTSYGHGTIRVLIESEEQWNKRLERDRAKLIAASMQAAPKTLAEKEIGK